MKLNTENIKELQNSIWRKRCKGNKINASSLAVESVTSVGSHKRDDETIITFGVTLENQRIGEIDLSIEDALILSTNLRHAVEQAAPDSNLLNFF